MKTIQELLSIANEKGVKSSYLNTLLYTGLRRNEALALNWEDIDFKKEIINVNKNLMWGKLPL